MSVNKKTITSLMIIFIGCFLVQTLFGETLAEPPSNFHESNAGSEENPFLISNLANLRWLSETPEVWVMLDYVDPDNNYIEKRYFFSQTDDIDATESITWNSGNGFQPIGSGFNNAFWGRYNGNDFMITNLYINRTNESYIGMFGRILEAIIQNVRLENVNITASVGPEGWRYQIGALIGEGTSSRVLNSSTTGNIYLFNDMGIRRADAGGLAGFLAGTYVGVVYSSVNIYSDFIEGLSIGGLVASSDGPPGLTMENSYFNGSIVRVEKNGTIAGISGGGFMFRARRIYVTSSKPFSYGVGLVRSIGSSGTLIESFWDVEATGTSIGVERSDHADLIMIEGLVSSEMKNSRIFEEAGWNFDTIWDINPYINNGYPFLRSIPPIEFSPPIDLYGKALETSIILSWEEPFETRKGILENYNIYRDGNLINSTQNLVFTDENVESGIEYEYFITAVYTNFEGESVPSNIINISINVSEFDEIDYKISLVHSAVFPNPVRGTDVRFTISNTVSNLSSKGEADFEINIYNIRGQLVKRSRNIQFKDGENVFIWNRMNDNGQEVANGVYFYRILLPVSTNGLENIQTSIQTGRFVILK